MSGPQRIDRLDAPPVKGRTYLVPTVEAEYRNVLRAWPVIGHLHDDVEFFRFEAKHYHFDVRFVPAAWMTGFPADPRRHDGSFDHYAPQTRATLTARRIVWLMGSPLQPTRRRPELPAPVWRPMIARRDGSQFHFIEAKPVRRLQAAFSGRICVRNGAGFVCPHRHAPLGSVAAVDGVITCPLHGLRIDANSGEVLA